MIELKDYLECIEYKITGGDSYLWWCFGPNARYMDCEKNEFEGGYASSVNIVFDTVDQTVYQMEAWDYELNTVYRWTHPMFFDLFKDECAYRGIDYQNASDESRYIDLDVPEDMLEKARAIAAGEAYDSRVKVELDLPDDEIFQMMKMAHEKDITLNEFVEQVLMAAIEARL